MSELISGKEALIALANGDDVEFKCGGMSWTTLDAKQQPLEILIDEKVRFRLKHHTITINGIEVPAPFEPKDGESYFYIYDADNGYRSTRFTHKDPVVIGAWRTEEEIKQVVRALRKLLNP